MISRQLTVLWSRLIGGRELTDDNRMVNAVLVITVTFLVPSTIINLASSLVPPFIINCILVVTFCILYQVSRFRQAYKTSLIVFAVVSYIGLIVTFFYNAGSYGPVMYLFFLSFYVLIAIAPRQQHMLWTTMHIIIGFGLMWLESSNTNFIKGNYITRSSRFIDIAFTYTISLFFMYLLTIHLRRKYEKEKNIATEQAEMMRLKSSLIASQNKRLRKIASVQSHEVRGQVATILGLSELIDAENPGNPANKEVLDGIKHASKNLDGIIKNINELTN